MKKTILSLCVVLSCLSVMADDAISSEKIILDGTVVNKFVNQMTFSDEDVILTFADNSTSTYSQSAVSIDILYDTTSTGIGSTVVDENKRDADKVYTVSGQYVGKDADNLPKGIYITKGKKIIVK